MGSMARYRMKPCRGKGNSISTQCNTLGVSTGHSRDREHKLRQWTPDACLVTGATTEYGLQPCKPGVSELQPKGGGGEVEHGRRFPRGVQRLGGQGLDVAKKKMFLQMSFQN